MPNFGVQKDGHATNHISYQTPFIKDDTTKVSSGDTSSRITAATIPLAVFNSAIPTTSYLSSANPIPLTHVCAYWRDVAINSSQLWSEICIDHPENLISSQTHLWRLESATFSVHSQPHPFKIKDSMITRPAAHSLEQAYKTRSGLFCGIAEIIHILSMSPNMQILRAEGSPKFLSEPAGDFFVNVVLPQLRKLHITYQVTGPRRSSERNQDDNSSWGLAAKFRHFLSQSKCQLRSDSDLRSHLCSTAFQSVSRLRITGSNLVTDDVIAAMTLGGRDVETMARFEETEITDGLVSTMVASRWLQPMDQRRKDVLVPQLEEVRLTRDFLDPFESVDSEKLSFMSAKGLRVL
ncbi:hypothetical protein BJ912DRAFT_961032 [Pholiota molesta]|nr:hypothetical protein BJ912DRAFT_961032 [Pholiota molesta]